MKRSILLSLLIIGAAATLLGSGTFAVFTTFSSDSGVLKSGSISMSVLGSGPNTLIFTGGAHCPDGLFPGDFCSDIVTVTNTSSVSNIKITGVTTAETGGLETCGIEIPPDSLTTTTAPLIPSIIGTILAPNGTTTFTIKTTLDSTADSSCQNQSASVGVTVAAESIP